MDWNNFLRSIPIFIHFHFHEIFLHIIGMWMFRRFLMKMHVSIQIRMLLHKGIHYLHKYLVCISLWTEKFVDEFKKIYSEYWFLCWVLFNLTIFFQSARNEESLSVELQSLKDQVNLKRSSMNEHVSHLESLREEVGLLASFTRNFIKMIWVMT